jgi:hypothetical protein
MAYQKGDLEIANAALKVAKDNYRDAEQRLAIARAELSRAERDSHGAFRALVAKVNATDTATDKNTNSPEQAPVKGLQSQSGINRSLSESAPREGVSFSPPGRSTPEASS